MVYNVGCLGNAFKLLSGFSGTKLPKNVAETVTSTNGSASWEQLRGGDFMQSSNGDFADCLAVFAAPKRIGLRSN